MANKELNKIESEIKQLEQYLDSCKPKAFSNDIILVEKSEIEMYIANLRSSIPDEVEYARKVLANREAIIIDAKDKASAHIQKAQDKAKDIENQAVQKANEIVSEDVTTKNAINEANQIIQEAYNEANNVLNDAQNNANDLQQMINDYVTDQLISLQDLVGRTLNEYEYRNQEVIGTLNAYYDTITSNLAELTQVPEEEQPEEGVMVESDELPDEVDSLIDEE